MKLTHINNQGRGRMVDVSHKSDTERTAVAKGEIYMQVDTIDMILGQTMQKGDVLAVAQVAGIAGAKKTSEIIPMCHNIFISGVDIEFDVQREKRCIEVTAQAKTVGKTGIEMEALTAVSCAALTIYDMCKAADKGMTISNIRLCKKTGGKSGDYIREQNI